MFRLPYIGIDLSTMLSADFAAAAVLIRYVDGDGDENDEQILVEIIPASLFVVLLK